MSLRRSAAGRRCSDGICCIPELKALDETPSAAATARRRSPPRHMRRLSCAPGQAWLCVRRTAGCARVRTRRTIAGTRLRRLWRSRASRLSGRVDRPTSSPRARPCARVLADRVKSACAHGRRAQGDASSPGSDEQPGPRPPVASPSRLRPDAGRRVGVVRSAIGPGDAARGERRNHRNPCEACSPAQAGAFRHPDGQEAKARMSKHLRIRRNWRRPRHLSGGSVSRVLHTRRPTCEALARRPRDFGAGDGLRHRQRSEAAAGSWRHRHPRRRSPPGSVIADSC